MNRTAFVIPWFGRELVGGAEQHIFQVTTRLAKRGHAIEVLTTCCPSFRDDWQLNQLPEGSTKESGVTVRRFPVRPRNAAAFDEANRELLELNDRRKLVGTSPLSARAARTFVEENIHSPRLLEHLEREARRYQAVVFAPYLYGPILSGVERAHGRAFLLPMLHDETYAYLPQVEDIFHSAKRILFNSEGEATLAARLYGPSMWRKGVITGEGVEVSAVTENSDHPPPAGVVASRYLLYLGRRDRTKNTDLLIRAFRRYRSSRPGSDLKMVLVGPGELSAEDRTVAGIVDLGVVDEPRKRWLLAHCRALVQPSRNESYSRTMMEAWLHARPVAVHAECLATSLAVDSARGGWAAADEVEWADLFDQIEGADDRQLRAMGERGRTYAREYADWDKAIDRYEEVLSLRIPDSRPRRPRYGARRAAIHQLLPNLTYGDAISNQAVFIREVLRELGYQSEIFVQYIDERMRDLARQFHPGAIASRDGLLYHHSIGTVLTPHAARHGGPKALIYHNVTPPSFFESWDPAHARLLESGRAGLSDLASSFPVSAGVSEYNASELRAAGFSDPRVVPIFVDPLRWAQPADPRWMKVLQDGRTNLLFVGRMAPNKCQHDLLESFESYLHHDSDARLLLIGNWRDGDRYAEFIHDRAQQLGVASQVILARGATDAQLLACYRTAHLFWSMSEHEGFCVPLVEAMWFDVPVLAYRSSAIPQTLGTAGLMFTEKKTVELGALAHLLVNDPQLRGSVLEPQRTRRKDFLPEAILPSFLELLRAMGGETRAERAVS